MFVPEPDMKAATLIGLAVFFGSKIGVIDMANLNVSELKGGVWIHGRTAYGAGRKVKCGYTFHTVSRAP